MVEQGVPVTFVSDLSSDVEMDGDGDGVGVSDIALLNVTECVALSALVVVTTIVSDEVELFVGKRVCDLVTRRESLTTTVSDMEGTSVPVAVGVDPLIDSV